MGYEIMQSSTEKTLRRKRGSAPVSRLALLLALLLPVWAGPGASQAAGSYGLYMSWSSNRSDAVLLAGATVYDNIYVFTGPDTAVYQVNFYLDDPNMAGPPRNVEKNAPYDFAGGSVGEASAFNTTTVSEGAHTITAALKLTTGVTEVVHATFTVANAFPKLTFNTSSLNFVVPNDGTASQTASLGTSDGSAGNYTVSDNAAWLSISPVGGVTPATVVVTVNTAELSPGIYRATATASASGYRSSTLKVHLTVGDQVHLAWVDDPSTALTVVWHTREKTTPSTVEYRPQGSTQWQSAPGALRTSGTTTGTLHEVKLSGLTPSTTYEYRYRKDGPTWSTVYTTRTAPPPGPADFDAVYVADTGLVGREDGLTTGTQQVIDEIAKLNPLVVLLGGDYAYYNTDKRFVTLNKTIDAWFNTMQPIGVRSPMMVAYGNHETLLGEGYQAWADRFPTPQGFDSRRNYSFDVGDVHFISIYAVHDTNGLPSTQLQWIENDMVAAKTRGQRWIIPFFHVSPFADGKNHPSNTNLRAQLGPIFERQGVKLAISSHDQAYERTFPLRDVPATNAPTSSSLTCYTMADGVTWVKSSPGGKLSNKNGDFSQFATNPAPKWTAFRDNTMHHFSRLIVSASGSIRFDTYGVKGDGTPPLIQDSFQYTTGNCPGHPDTTPPETTITTGPSGSTNSSSATFDFSSSEADSTFECSLGGMPFSACTSPKAFNELGEGTYTFKVRATDAAGNTDATPASRTWTIDSTAPAASSVTPTDGTIDVAANGNATATFSEAMNAATVNASTVTLVKQGTNTPLAANVTYDATSKTATLNPNVDLELETAYAATVKGGPSGAKDLAGNSLAVDKVWSFTTSAAHPPPPPSLTGLTGQYYDNQDLTNQKLTRVDSMVNFDWGSGSPDPAIAPDSFSVRWTGQVKADYSQTYTFYTTSNDGVRLWVNNQLVIDNWTDHRTTENYGRIVLQAGQWYPIRLEYYEGTGSAVISLSYSSSSTPKQIIPRDYLAPNSP